MSSRASSEGPGGRVPRNTCLEPPTAQVPRSTLGMTCWGYALNPLTTPVTCLPSTHQCTITGTLASVFSQVSVSRPVLSLTDLMPITNVSTVSLTARTFIFVRPRSCFSS